MGRLFGALLVLLLAHCCIQAGRASNPSRKSLRSIDCRRLVFHPQCRGIAAKRSMPSLQEERYQLDRSRGRVSRRTPTMTSSSGWTTTRRPPRTRTASGSTGWVRPLTPSWSWRRTTATTSSRPTRPCRWPATT
ncbi:Elevenin [Frankliniella occidentalis]|nr:Elevenin [Frankliniella occidentalis]